MKSNVILNLAISDNCCDLGSFVTPWMDKVAVFRRLLYNACQEAGIPIASFTDSSSVDKKVLKSWRRSCYIAFLEENVDIIVSFKCLLIWWA